jgi:hypothetical protein
VQRKRALRRIGYLRELGFSQEDAKDRLQELACSGLPAWLQDRYRHTLRYISANGLLVVPVWHTLARGLERDLLMYAVRTPLQGVPDDHPVVFNSEARETVRVCSFRCVTDLLRTNEQYAAQEIHSYWKDTRILSVLVRCCLP